MQEHRVEFASLVCALHCDGVGEHLELARLSVSVSETGPLDDVVRSIRERLSEHHVADLDHYMLRVDQFKSLNDALGHPAGDAVLTGIAAIFRRSVRVFDVCARFGGDEFAILMPGSHAGAAQQSAERIRRRIEDYWPESIAPRPVGLRISASLGVAVLRPDTTAAELVEHADRALYAAKANGRNCVCLSTA